ncbi:hypothetical protein J8273_2296 [Carpediemonas membranifera]|uniref:YEATS domain-containing protein n=1 Tax=Carpediemonas membranifera TaxID=201153 RepID=A0A8J6E5L6_9EUKA|nr:hypothetical protein J8273_2296 [Carpediemonas membranifera]|eukprot:KAG9395947.1 hypothetical protein J8273_2296 [Carpediemonas membranifera]
MAENGKIERSTRVYSKSILFGNVTRRLDTSVEPEAFTHEFTVFVRGFDNQDLSYLLKSVEVLLHDSMDRPHRVLRKPPFETSCMCFAESEIAVTLNFVDEAMCAPVTIRFVCFLHPQVSTIRPDFFVNQLADTLIFPFPPVQFERILLGGPTSKVTNSELDKRMREHSKRANRSGHEDPSLGFCSMADLIAMEKADGAAMGKTIVRLTKELETKKTKG